MVGELENSKETNITMLLNKAEELTISAHSRGIVTDTERVLFFNRSQIEREEFSNFPNPVVWNGLADNIYIKEGEQHP